MRSAAIRHEDDVKRTALLRVSRYQATAAKRFVIGMGRYN
jgi:hypothetical protein